MEQSPWKANWFSASKDIHRVLYDHIHKCAPPVPIPCHIHLVQAPTSHSRRSILILSSHLRLGLPSGLFPSGFSTKTLYVPLFFPIRATAPAHLILFDLITRTIITIIKVILQRNNFVKYACRGIESKDSYRHSYPSTRDYLLSHNTVFLKRRAAARYRALVSFIPGREKFPWNLSF